MVKTKGLTINQDRFHGYLKRWVRCAVRGTGCSLITSSRISQAVHRRSTTYVGNFHVTCVFTRNDFTHHKWFERVRWPSNVAHHIGTFKCWTNTITERSEKVQHVYQSKFWRKRPCLQHKHVAQRIYGRLPGPVLDDHDVHYPIRASTASCNIRFRFARDTWVFNSSKRAKQFVTVDNTTKIVQVWCHKTSTIQLNHWTKVWVAILAGENHPFWFRCRLWRHQNVQTTNSLNTFLTSCFVFNSSLWVQQFASKSTCFKCLDSFCTHLAANGPCPYSCNFHDIHVLSREIFGFSEVFPLDR